MNKGLLVLNIFLVVAVGVLFYLFLNNKNGDPGSTSRSRLPDTTSVWQPTPVAYFDMDSVEANFTLFKQMQAEVVKREANINDSISQMRLSFQKYYQRLQAESGRWTADEKDSLGNVLAQMDGEIKNRAAEMNQNYQAYYMSKQQEIVSLIKTYCREFNKDKRYSYIIAREPGLFYYTDTAYNVTGELLKGLNEYYNKKKN